jgi:hypothetical protein
LFQGCIKGKKTLFLLPVDGSFMPATWKNAQMAELVDALVSGTSIRKYVQVRVLFWAQLRKQINRAGRGIDPPAFLKQPCFR